MNSLFCGILLLSLFCTASFAQSLDGKVVRANVQGKDTVPFQYLPQVTVEAKMDTDFLTKRIIYFKMKRDVRAALPYARMAAAKMKEIETVSASFKNPRQRRKYMRAEEDSMKVQFEEKLKNLTVNQGRVLIKLIDRECGSTTYHLVKDLRGSFNAFLWQCLAFAWGSNLNTKYDPTGEDKLMEQAVLDVDMENAEKEKRKTK